MASRIRLGRRGGSRAARRPEPPGISVWMPAVRGRIRSSRRDGSAIFVRVPLHDAGGPRWYHWGLPAIDGGRGEGDDPGRHLQSGDRLSAARQVASRCCVLAARGDMIVEVVKVTETPRAPHPRQRELLQSEAEAEKSPRTSPGEGFFAKGAGIQARLGRWRAQRQQRAAGAGGQAGSRFVRPSRGSARACPPLPPASPGPPRTPPLARGRCSSRTLRWWPARCAAMARGPRELPPPAPERQGSADDDNAGQHRQVETASARSPPCR